MATIEIEFPDNSDTAKENPPFEPDPPKLATTRRSYDAPEKIRRKDIPKKSSGRKLLQSFIQDDAESISDFILYDILIPKIKDIIFEGIDGALSRILWGDNRAASVSRNGSRSQVSYNSMYKPQYSSRRNEPVERNFINVASDPEHVYVSSRQEGERVLDEMNYILEEDGCVCIKDMYRIARISDNNYMNLEYGWYSLRNAYVDKDRSGWVLRMPRPVYLGNANNRNSGPRDE